jgi:hypothetical protein
MKIYKMITMKTIYILTALAGLQFNNMFAATNYSESTLSANETVIVDTYALIAPATPAEASFEDLDEFNAALINLSLLAPVITLVADFNDSAPEASAIVTDLSPVTPLVAEFEEVNITSIASPDQQLAPVTPAEAVFEESI